MEDFGDEVAGSLPHKDLEDLSLQEIQQLRSKIGIKQFNKRYGRGKGTSHRTSVKARRKTGKDAGPVEISSKKPKNPTTSLPKKVVSRDPRFDDLSGHYDEQLFKRSYKFIDRMKAKEFKAVKKISEDQELDEETRRKAKDMLTRMGQKKAAKQKESAASRVEKALKEERKQALQDGRNPYFLKSSEKNKLILAEKYKELKDKGQLDAFMKKKRKQNAKKNAGSIPKGDAQKQR